MRGMLKFVDFQINIYSDSDVFKTGAVETLLYISEVNRYKLCVCTLHSKGHLLNISKKLE